MPGGLRLFFFFKEVFFWNTLVCSATSVMYSSIGIIVVKNLCGIFAAFRQKSGQNLCINPCYMIWSGVGRGEGLSHPKNYGKKMQ